jgi:hypothetical protein
MLILSIWIHLNLNQHVHGFLYSDIFFIIFICDGQHDGDGLFILVFLAGASISILF